MVVGHLNLLFDCKDRVVSVVFKIEDKSFYIHYCSKINTFKTKKIENINKNYELASGHFVSKLFKINASTVFMKSIFFPSCGICIYIIRNPVVIGNYKLKYNFELKSSNSFKKQN
jgi:hypothetical protein